MAEAERKPNLQLRRARGGLSQAALAEQVNLEVLRATGRPGTISAKSVSDWERGWYTWPTADVRNALCQILCVGEAADLGFYKRRTAAAERKLGYQPEGGVLSLLQLVEDRPAGIADLVEGQVYVPGGRSFRGAELSAQYCTLKSADGRPMLAPTSDLLDALGRSDRRTILVASPAAGDGSSVYLVDGREQAARMARHSQPHQIPTAYRLDDLTIGIVWAVTNSDTAILADDGALDTYQRLLAPYEERPASSATLSEVPRLNNVSRQWLGSRFCSRHIIRHLARLNSPPLFWTREQRGEEAASWLLWAHKLAYLRHTSRRSDGIRRGFCIPEHEVRTSPRYERVLLLLATALMEACGIEVQVSPAPELGEVEGFVLADEVIVANWLRQPALWYVDTGAPSSRWATYRDISGYLGSKSVIAHPTPLGRLQAMSAYLDVPWTWFTSRCRELAATGVDGLAHPRSRLLTTDGLATALRYVGSLELPDLPEGADIARR